MTQSTISLRDRLVARKELGIAAPLHVLLLIAVAIPVAYLIYGALQSGSPSAPTSEFTWTNIRNLFTEVRYRAVLFNTLKLATITTVVSVLTGLIFAWLISRTDIPGRKVLEPLIPIPLFLAPFAGAVAWVILGSERAGLINVLYQRVTGAEDGLFNIMTLPGLIFVMSLFFIPYAYLFVIAPMQNLDGAMEEASRVSGANLTQTIRRVSFPVILPSVLSATLMVFVLSAELFSIPALIGTAAGYETIPTFIHRSTQYTPADWGGAAAAGLVLLVIVGVGMVLQYRATQLSSRFVTVTGKGLKPSRIPLGRWRWPAASLPVIYLMVAIVLPGAALLLGSFMQFFTPDFSVDLLSMRHWDRVVGGSQFKTALTNTLWIGAIGPVVTVAFGFLLAYTWHRTKMPLKRAAETVAMMPIAIPGIVFGVGVLWAFVASPLYGTLWLLLAAYAVRYLPYPVRVFSSTMVQVDKSLDEASRVGGAGVWRTLRSIAAPILKQSGLSSWLLLFIVFTRELNVAIMVVTGGTVTLPVQMFMEADGGSFQGAAIIAIIQSVFVLVAFVAARSIFKIDLAETQGIS